MATTDIAGPVPIEKKMERLASETFAALMRAYMEASDEIQAVIREMSEIVNDPQNDEETREAALSTLVDALFPSKHNGALGIELNDLDCEQRKNPEVAEVIDEADAEEASFADRLESLMEAKGFTQAQLAEALGVQQPAISMMLSRQCRPQRRTIRKIAEALGVDPKELWPNFT